MPDVDATLQSARQDELIRLLLAARRENEREEPHDRSQGAILADAIELFRGDIDALALMVAAMRLQLPE